MVSVPSGTFMADRGQPKKAESPMERSWLPSSKVALSKAVQSAKALSWISWTELGSSTCVSVGEQE